MAPPETWRARTRSKSSSRALVTTAPPITSACPPRYLVVACKTRSAPSLSGDWRTGVEEAARIRAVGLALERGGRVDGGRDRARPRIDAGARVHGDRLDSHGTHLTRGRFRWRR